MEESGASFKQETVVKLMQLHFKDDKVKINADTAKLAAEVLRVFVAEGAARASKVAEDESSAVVTIEHFEKVLPQLLLDC
ncbi:Centromere protein X [Lamellibrachia satsuma]|nr:Centromere protein X [Lamellibrachia satsuma]